MSKKIKQITHRTPYDVWSNSQLSVARFYGGIKYNGKDYTYDPEVLKQMAEDTKNWVSEDKLYKPDLVTYE